LPKDIRWVVSVPAIWSEPAKQLMKRAAIQVSIDKTFEKEY